MERDEAGTHQRLKAGRQELFEPEIAGHHGRVFKLVGDGMLNEDVSELYQFVKLGASVTVL